MEQKIKYTTDGKKVVVLGSINSQEKIVQEVFVIDGSEIPSGEHFVVKSLHDFPAESWKEKHLKEIEEKYNKTYKQKNEEYEKMCKEFDFKTRVVREKLSFLYKLEKTFSKQKLNQLIDFISGDVKFIVYERYGDLEISEYDSSIATKEYGRFESVRLLSVYGTTDGDLQYKINEYCDGSGTWSKVYPCKTAEQALLILKERFFVLLEKGLTDSLLKVSQKYNIQVPKDKIEEYKFKKRNAIVEEIEKQNKRLQTLNEDLLKYNP